jgi:hypothetical protein
MTVVFTFRLGITMRSGAMACTATLVDDGEADGDAVTDDVAVGVDDGVTMLGSG